jgi:hypothetical protein
MANGEKNEFLDELRAHRRIAESEHKGIQSIVDDIVREAPDGIPLSDWKHQCVRTAREAAAAFEDYKNAFQKFWDYVIHGREPEGS